MCEREVCCHGNIPTSQLMIVLELMRDGDLRQLLIDKRQGQVPRLI